MNSDQDDQWVRNYRGVTIKIKDGTVISGKLNIGEYARVSDLLRQSQDQYIVLTEAEHRGSAGKVVIINRHEIMWAEPKED
jgi:ribosomal protein S4E